MSASIGNYGKVLHEKNAKGGAAVRACYLALVLQYLHDQGGRRYGHGEADDHGGLPEHIVQQGKAADYSSGKNDLERAETEDLASHGPQA